MKGREATEVLCYSFAPCSRATVYRHYLEWRKSQELPRRCDNPQCQFLTAPLDWNGKPLPLILDHIDGNPKNNSTNNLRFLCPNCDAQLPTRGGKNKGRIQNGHETGYEIAYPDGQRRDAKVFPKGLGLKISIGQPTVFVSSSKDK